jgi:hypothetical protein
VTVVQADSTAAREAAEGARRAVVGERAEWHRARDSLAANVRRAEAKAREAEEETVRAEQEAHTLRLELEALRQVGGRESWRRDLHPRVHTLRRCA